MTGRAEDGDEVSGRTAIDIYMTLQGGLARYGPADRGGSVAMRLPAGATIADAIDALGLPAGSVAFAALNGRRAAWADDLKDGDELALFGRLGGG